MHGDARRGADAARAARRLERGVRGRGAQPLDGGQEARAGIDVERERELVPAEPTERLVLAQRRTQPGHRVDEHGVAGGVAKLVVDGLEPVEVERDDDEQRVLVATAARADAAREPGLELGPVPRAGQRIDRRVAVQPLERTDHLAHDRGGRQRGGPQHRREQHQSARERGVDAVGVFGHRGLRQQQPALPAPSPNSSASAASPMSATVGTRPSGRASFQRATSE